MNVILDDAGVFSATPVNEIEFLYFDGTHPDDVAKEGNLGRWTLMSCPAAAAEAADASSFVMIGQYRDLDEALAAMAQSDKFQVELPGGGRFTRPGDVPALEILSRLGFDAIRTLSVFAIVDDPPDADPEEVRLSVARKLMGTNANVAPVTTGDLIGGDGVPEGWSVEIRLPIEGVVRKDGLKSLVDREIGAADLQIADEMAIDDVEIPRDDESNTVVFHSFGRR